MSERMGLLVNSIPDRSLITSFKLYGSLLFTSQSGAISPSEQFPHPAVFGYFLTSKSIRERTTLLAVR